MIELNGNNLTLDKLRQISEGKKVSVSPETIERVSQCRKIVDKLVSDERVVYGVTTGFGHLCNTRIGTGDIERLQTNLLRSHATGVGDPFSRSEVRGMMAIRINSLLQGVSGVRPEIIHGLIDLLNHNVVPWVPQKGSVGSSGDLAPLSHMALVLIGEGETIGENGQQIPANESLKKAGLTPLKLQAKEGLALINGTGAMTSVLGLSLHRGLQISCSADIIASLTLDVMRGSLDPFDADFISLR
ncbi:aromatic amino acid lyase, partial [bacterium]|nr:aromatic amino acid lyase [bacterium]